MYNYRMLHEKFCRNWMLISFFPWKLLINRTIRFSAQVGTGFLLARQILIQSHVIYFFQYLICSNYLSHVLTLYWELQREMRRGMKSLDTEWNFNSNLYFIKRNKKKFRKYYLSQYGRIYKTKALNSDG